MVELLRIEPWVKFRDQGWAWTEQFGYPQDSFYTNANTRLEEVFGDAPPHIKEFADRHFDPWCVSMIRQSPGQCIPEHRDKHYKFKRQYGEHDDLVRYCVFLEDWQPGHYLEYDGEPITKWQAGQYFKIWPEVPHRSANMGSVYKYTCQITGIEKR